MGRGPRNVGKAVAVRRVPSAITVLVMTAVITAISPGIIVASANSCAEACRNQHNQCRIQTKGSPSCDAALTACLSRCNAKR